MIKKTTPVVSALVSVLVEVDVEVEVEVDVEGSGAVVVAGPSDPSLDEPVSACGGSIVGPHANASTTSGSVGSK